MSISKFFESSSRISTQCNSVNFSPTISEFKLFLPTKIIVGVCIIFPVISTMSLVRYLKNPFPVVRITSYLFPTTKSLHNITSLESWHSNSKKCEVKDKTGSFSFEIGIDTTPSLLNRPFD